MIKKKVVTKIKIKNPISFFPQEIRSRMTLLFLTPYFLKIIKVPSNSHDPVIFILSL